MKRKHLEIYNCDAILSDGVGIVGLDLSLSGTGMARIEKIKNDPILRHTYFFPTNVSDGSRIKRSQDIFYAIQENSDINDLFFIEDYAFTINPKASMLATLGELGGIVKLKILEWTGAEPRTIAQGSWKKFLSGDGRLNKDGFKLAVFKKFDIECRTNDEAAALGVADLAWNLFSGHKRQLLKYEEDVIKNYRKLHRENK